MCAEGVLGLARVDLGEDLLHGRRHSDLCHISQRLHELLGVPIELELETLEDEVFVVGVVRQPCLVHIVCTCQAYVAPRLPMHHTQPHQHRVVDVCDLLFRVHLVICYDAMDLGLSPKSAH